MHIVSSSGEKFALPFAYREQILLDFFRLFQRITEVLVSQKTLILRAFQSILEFGGRRESERLVFMKYMETLEY